MDWGRVAVFYDWQLRLERPALAAARALAEPRSDDYLLDVGTGTGALLRELARQAGRPRTAIGLDASPRMLAKVPALPPGWTLQTADARRLQFTDGAFSVVTAAYLLHVVDPATRHEIIHECHRVLRPGGRLVTVTPALPRTRVARALYAPLAAGSFVGPAAGLRPPTLGRHWSKPPLRSRPPNAFGVATHRSAFSRSVDRNDSHRVRRRTRRASKVRLPGCHLDSAVRMSWRRLACVRSAPAWSVASQAPSRP